MAGPVTLRNAADTWTNGQTGYQNRNYGTTSAIRLRTTGGDHRGWMFFALPFPRGATILSATLRVYSREAWAGEVITVRRASAKWSVNKITHNNKPGVTGATVASAAITGARGKEVAINVASIMQEVANGAAWYGFHMISAGADISIYSAQSTATSKRPTLTITWIDAPKAPTVMSPTGNHAITAAKPVLSFNYLDPSADSPMESVQVQIDPAANWAAPAWDSGEVASTVPQLDLTTTAYPGLAADASTYWRVRVKDSGNLWSAWSHTVNGQGNQFQRKAKGTVTITSPADAPNNFVWDPSPPIDWSVAGMVQKNFQVLIVDPANTSTIYYNSGKTTSAITSVTPPLSVLRYTGKTYRVIVRVWDALERETNSGDPAWSEAFKDFTYNYDATVAPVTALAAAKSGDLPSVDLTWNRAAQPDFWAIVRDGVVVDRIAGYEAFVAGTSYKYTDLDAPGREEHTWSVLAIVDGVQSAANPTVDFMVNIDYPWLMRTDGTDAIALVGKNARPQWSMAMQSNQELHEVLGDYPPVLITQSLGGYAGHVEGLLHGDVIPGVTAKQMRDRLKSIRDDPGIELVLMLADESIRVAIYNVTWTPDTSPGGVDYWAAFDYVQVVY